MTRKQAGSPRSSPRLHETVVALNGELIQPRGDEALCVFGSARQALRAAVELQRAFRRRSEDVPVFRLPIGVGLDAGEAVPIEGGYRGGALNTAARYSHLDTLPRARSAPAPGDLRFAAGDGDGARAFVVILAPVLPRLRDELGTTG